jgi:mRNA interferase YafQ
MIPGPVYTARFNKDTARAVRRGHDLELLRRVLRQLVSGEALAPRHRDHALVGRYAGLRDCHVAPDWVLLYRRVGAGLILERLGSHADLF